MGDILGRDVSIDYLRSFVTVSVVAHHAALAYTTFSQFDPRNYKSATAPVVDIGRFLPLDLMVGWNDLFFMSLMFLISGLFVAPSLSRKGAGLFLIGRAKRLGIPFMLATFVLSPMTYYASWLLSAYAGQQNFLADFFSGGVWSSGPLWFVSVLLAFSCITAVSFRFCPALMARLSWAAGSSMNLVIIFIAAALITTVPISLMGWPAGVNLIGPLGMAHPSRIFLYFIYFLLGVALGASNIKGSLSRRNLRYWPLWLILGAISYLINGMTGVLFPRLSPDSQIMVDSITMSFCCALTTLASLGIARSFFLKTWRIADNLSDNAYGIYIVHYFFVIWMQFILLTQPYPAIAKFLIVFSVGLAAAWMSTALLRKTVFGSLL